MQFRHFFCSIWDICITFDQGWKLLCQYKFDIGSGSWQHNLLGSNSIESKRLKKKFEEPKWPQIFKESIKAFETAEKAAKKLDVKDNQGRSYISFIIKGKKAVMIHANDIDFQTKSGVICFIK